MIWRVTLSQVFTAGTQYNDYTGTVAADRSDNLSFQDYLKDRGLVADGEHIVGYEIVFNENSGQPISKPGIVAFIGQGDSISDVAAQRAQDGVIKLRCVEVSDLPLAEFFRFFKRFNVMFSNDDLKLRGAEYQSVE